MNKLEYDSKDILALEQRYRAMFINSLGGFKSLSLIGTRNSKGQSNLAVFNSFFHIGANPPFFGFIVRPDSVERHTLDRKAKAQKPIPEDIKIESKIAERVLSDLSSVNSLGQQVPFNCPGCGGVLWHMNKGPLLRYRCHTGHAYTAAVLLAEQTKKIEETMWTALRMFEERKNLLTTMAKQQKGSLAKSSRERADISQVHIDRIKAILLADDKVTSSDMPK